MADIVGKPNTRGVRCRATSLVLALVLVINGCASVEKPAVPYPLAAPRPNPFALLIAPARFEPVAKIEAVLRTKEQAASEGAVKGAKGALAGPVTDPYALLLIPIIVPIGALIGAIVETSRAPSDEAVAIARQNFANAIAALQVQQRMHQAVMAELQTEGVGKSLALDEGIGPKDREDRPVYSDAAAPMVLELSVLEFGFTDKKAGYRETAGSSAPGYALTLTTRSRLVDTSRGTVLDEMQHFHRSEPFTPAVWMVDDAARFRAKLEEAIQGAAKDIVLEFFLLYYPPKPDVPADQEPARGDVIPYYVLKPIYPDVKRGGLDMRGIFSDRYVSGLGGMQFTRVDDIQPTFRWERFPRDVDLTGHEENRARFTELSYEIAVYEAQMNRLGRAKYFAAGPLRYLRKNLPEPLHRMEEPLEPCGRYAWTVRPRFKLDGEPRVGEWTGSYGLSDLNPQPWKIRRALPPFETYGLGSKDSFLLFRAPPPEGGEECAD